MAGNLFVTHICFTCVAKKGSLNPEAVKMLSSQIFRERSCRLCTDILTWVNICAHTSFLHSVNSKKLLDLSRWRHDWIKQWRVMFSIHRCLCALADTCLGLVAGLQCLLVFLDRQQQCCSDIIAARSCAASDLWINTYITLDYVVLCCQTVFACNFRYCKVVNIHRFIWLLRKSHLRNRVNDRR